MDMKVNKKMKGGKMNKRDLNSAILYAIVTGFLLVILGIIKKHDYTIILFVVILAGLLAGFVGYFISKALRSRNIPDFLKIDHKSINEKEFLIILISGFIFWQLAKHFLSDLGAIGGISMALGFIIGVGIIKLIRRS